MKPTTQCLLEVPAYEVTWLQSKGEGGRGDLQPSHWPLAAEVMTRQLSSVTFLQHKTAWGTGVATLAE